MGRAVALREDFDGPALRRLAKASKDAGQSRRLLALAEIYDGGRRTEAARIGTVGLQVVRDWVLRFNAKGPDGLIDGKATGKPAKLNDRQRQALARLVESGPIPAIHGVVRWRRKDLAHWIFEEFRISVDETTVGRELRALGFRTSSLGLLRADRFRRSTVSCVGAERTWRIGYSIPHFGATTPQGAERVCRRGF